MRAVDSMKIGVISPQDWGLPAANSAIAHPIPQLGASPMALEQRIQQNVYQWLPRQFDEPTGAFNGFYSALRQCFEPPQTVNLIAPWLALAAYDRYHGEQFLVMARRAADWFYDHFVETHPMSVAIGGVRERLAGGDLWTKFAAEFVLLNVGLQDRTGQSVYLDRAEQSLRFLVQSTRHDFAPRYDPHTGRWLALGWQSFGRIIEAFLIMADRTGTPEWERYARRWGHLGCSLQAADGGFYLIDGDYFNTDLAADELRAFVFLYERTHKPKYLKAAKRFAAWLLKQQRDDGAWPLTIDRDDNVVVPTVGPGDVPNIAISLLRLHHVTGKARYLQAAASALRYSLTTQVLEGSGQPYADDPNVQGGFWSWDPPYDYTMSGDQATHHVRGIMFALDYWSHLESNV